MTFKEYCKYRFYFRGFTPLGILNTVLAWLFNRVVVLHKNFYGEVRYLTLEKGTDHKYD